MVRIRHRQESVVIKHVADGLSPVKWATLNSLVTRVGPSQTGSVFGRDETGPSTPQPPHFGVFTVRE
jgi:hypothetical protein